MNVIRFPKINPRKSESWPVFRREPGEADWETLHRLRKATGPLVLATSARRVIERKREAHKRIRARLKRREAIKAAKSQRGAE